MFNKIKDLRSLENENKAAIIQKLSKICFHKFKILDKKLY